MIDLPLAPQPGRGVEMAYLEKFPPPEPVESEALERVWGEIEPQRRRERRDLLLPALQALQEARGWISPPALAAVCRELTVPLADAHGVASFYHMLSTEPGARRTIHVCDDVACRLKGAGALVERLQELLGGSAAPDAALGWELSPCLGMCDHAPAALCGDESLKEMTPASLQRYVESAGTPAGQGEVTPEKGEVTPENGTVLGRGTHVGSVGDGLPVLLVRCGKVDPFSLEEYTAHGGYAGLRKAVEVGPKECIGELERSRLVGRGGAAFPTARKWAAVAAEPGPRFVVCNADESEPGTFKDRVLLEQDPFAVIEGMTIAAFSVGAAKGYLYLRGEYPEALRVLRRALKAARQGGYLGDNILGAGFAFDIEIRRGAGAYVCGEETALFNSIEGYRGEPRARPPFPTQVGLFGRPTLINNVETLAAVAPIVSRGGEWYAGLGTPGSAGTKLVSVSGHVTRPGVYEVLFGTPLREIIDGAAGGVPSGRSIGAVLCGGAAGTFLTPEQLDQGLAFETLRSIGGTVGSGALVVYDETADLGDAVERIARFFMEESCGQCVPCRVGTRRQWEVVRKLRDEVTGVASARELLADLAQVMRDSSICGLGQLAPNALLSVRDRLW